MTDYLTLVEVLAIHEDQIERDGGARGVRGGGLLEAALYRPQTGYYSDILEEAAALWEIVERLVRPVGFGDILALEAISDKDAAHQQPVVNTQY